MTTTAAARGPARVGEGNSAGARNMPRGFLAEVAEGVAGAVVSAPEFAAAVLLGLTLWFSFPAVCVGFGHLAGVCLARATVTRRRQILLAWAVVVVSQYFAHGEGSAWFSGYSDWLQFSPVAMTSVAVAWGARRAGAAWALALLAVAATGALAVFGESPGFMLGYSLMQWAAFATLTIGRFAPLRVAVVAALAIGGTEAFLALGVWPIGRVSPATWLTWLAPMPLHLLLAAVCGAAARAAERRAQADGGALLIVALQRRPWITALVIAALVQWYSWIGIGTMFDADPAAWWARVLSVVVTGALVGALVLHAHGVFAKFAALFASTTTTALALMQLSGWRAAAGLVGDEWNGLLVAAAYLAPPVVAAVAAIAPRRKVAPTILLLTGVAAIPSLCWVFEFDPWPFIGLASIVLTPVALIAVARSAVPASHVVVNAVLLGIAARIVLELAPNDATQRLGAWSAYDLPAAWFVGGVFAVFARRALSMTAVPLDHPCVVDFDRGVLRAAG